MESYGCGIGSRPLCNKLDSDLWIIERKQFICSTKSHNAFMGYSLTPYVLTQTIEIAN